MFNKVTHKQRSKARIADLEADDKDTPTSLPISKPSKAIKKHRGVVVSVNPSKESTKDSCKESNKGILTRTFKSVTNLSAVERNLYFSLIV